MKLTFFTYFTSLCPFCWLEEIDILFVRFNAKRFNFIFLLTFFQFFSVTYTILQLKTQNRSKRFSPNLIKTFNFSLINK